MLKSMHMKISFWVGMGHFPKPRFYQLVAHGNALHRGILYSPGDFKSRGE